MARILGLQCLRCGRRYPAEHHALDCPTCRAQQAPSNLVVAYPPDAFAPRPRPVAGPAGLWRFADLLPVAAEDAVSLCEGGTPLRRLARVGAALGLSHLHGKDESRNPTWSFKDRLASMAVSAARSMGATTIVSSSTGNAGAAAAAYAAAAGLPCVVFTFKGASPALQAQMSAYGAAVVEVADKAHRWTLMEHAVRSFGWFPTSPYFGPVVGSNPFGIEGYKTLAYEIAESLDWQVPDWCILPVCYGDALVGIWRGFSDMLAMGWTDRMPRLVAAEAYGSIASALAEHTDAPPEVRPNEMTLATSIGAARGTYQAVNIIRASGGAAVTCANDDILSWRSRLAQEEGLFVEASSACPLVALEHLRAQGRVASGDTVVVLLTATGLKDPHLSMPGAAPPFRVAERLDTAIDQLTEAGIFPRQ